MTVGRTGTGYVDACIYSYNGNKLYARANTGWESERFTSPSGICTWQSSYSVTSYKLCQDKAFQIDPCTSPIYP